MSTRSNSAGFLTGVLAPNARPAAPGIVPVSEDEALLMGRQRADVLRSMGIEDPSVLALVRDLELILDPPPPLPDNTAEAPDARERELDRRRKVVMAKIGQAAAKRYLNELGSSSLLEDARRLRVDACFPETVPTDEGQRAIELGKWMESFTAAIYEADQRQRFIQRAQAPWWKLVPWWAWSLFVLVIVALVVGNILLALRR